MKFYFGTTNPYKIRELASIIRPLEIELNITDPIDPEETANSFEGNAEIKAKEYAKYIRNQLTIKMIDDNKCNSENDAINYLLLDETFTISEDSGIIIHALGKLPGPWSARFNDFSEIDIQKGILSGYKKSNLTREEIDLKNNERVLNLLEGIQPSERHAKFIVSLKVADINENIVFSSTGEMNGTISEIQKGKDGFGYDPIFISENSFGKTWAEIDSMRKNIISHRRKALQDFTKWIVEKLNQSEIPSLHIQSNSKFDTIVIDGNDGTGKSTLVKKLQLAGYTVKDRGIPTKLTDTDDLKPIPGEFYIILDAPVEISRERLQKAGRDLNEKYHTIEDLTYYRKRFLEVASQLKDKCVVVDASKNEFDLFNEIIKILKRVE